MPHINSYKVRPKDRPTELLSGVEDGSGYWAAVKTRKDFGCVLWEKNE